MKRLLLVVTLVSAATLGLGAWYSRHTAILARAERWQAQQEEQAADALLDQPITLDGRQVTLVELCDLVANKTGLEVVIDTHEIGPQEFFFLLPIGTFTVRSALDRVLQPSDLDYTFHGSSLVITTQDATDYDLRTVVYPLPQPMLTEVTEDEWLELITTSIQPNGWDEVGGRGHIEPSDGALVVVQTPRVHRRLRAALAALAEMESAPQSSEPRWLLPPCDAARRQMLAALDQRVSAEFQQQSLRQVVAHLTCRHGISLGIDVERLAEAGVSIEQPVTLQMRNVTLRSLLAELMEQLELALSDQGDSLVITTPENAEDNLPVIAYPVHDLVWYDGFVDFDSLIDLITTSVTPTSWGEGNNNFIASLGSGWLILPQRTESHAQTESLLTRLRAGIARGGEPVVASMPSESATHERIRDVLRRPIALDFKQMPLRQVIDRLAAAQQIQILLDERRLREAGVSTDLPITWHMPPIPLGSQLYWMLREPDLMWTIRNECLVITTTAETEWRQPARVYDVRNLTDPDLGLAGRFADVEALIEKLVPESLSPHRGWRAVTELQGLLVVSDSDRVHEELGRLLVALEDHRRRRTANAASQPQLVRIESSPSAERIERILDEKISVSYCAVPLEELLRDLAGRLELPVAFDQAAVVIEGYDFQEIVSFSAHERPLAEILDALFATNEFHYEIRSDVLFFTFKSRREQEPQTRLYRVRDLLSPADPAGLENLAQRLPAADAYYWDSNRGGSGAVVPLGTEWLAISADWRMHQVVEDWLTQQRTGQQPLRAIERAKRLELQSHQGHVRREISAGRFPITFP